MDKQDLEWCRVQSFDKVETIVNISLLRSHPLVTTDESQIFRWISGLEKHPTMEKETHSTVEEGLQYMFYNYRIGNRDWKALVGYLLAPESYTLRLLDKKRIFDL